MRGEVSQEIVDRGSYPVMRARLAPILPRRGALLHPRGLVGECVHAMLMHALEVEADDYIRFSSDSDEIGYAPIVRNGRARARVITFGPFQLVVEAPRVHDRRPGRRFVSKVLPPYRRRSPRLDDLARVLHQPGLSKEDLASALNAFLGSLTLSFTSMARLVSDWEQAYAKLERAARETSGHE